jgi:hypothetical protein
MKRRAQRKMDELERENYDAYVLMGKVQIDD